MTIKRIAIPARIVHWRRFTACSVGVVPARDDTVVVRSRLPGSASHHVRGTWTVLAASIAVECFGWYMFGPSGWQGKLADPVSTAAAKQLVSMIGVADRDAFKQASLMHVFPPGEECLVPFVGERTVKHVSKNFPKHNDAVCTGLERRCCDIH